MQISGTTVVFIVTDNETDGSPTWPGPNYNELRALATEADRCRRVAAEHRALAARYRQEYGERDWLAPATEAEAEAMEMRAAAFSSYVDRVCALARSEGLVVHQDLLGDRRLGRPAVRLGDHVLLGCVGVVARLTGETWRRLDVVEEIDLTHDTSAVIAQA
jgi:hypothetical protein